MWPGIVMANSYLACQVGYPYWWWGRVLACGTKGREFESRQGHPCLGLQMAQSAGWVCGLCLRGQTDKMTVEDTVTVTSGRGQLWREDMWPGIVMANSYLACQVGYPYWWWGRVLACGTKGREFESRQGHPCLGLHVHMYDNTYVIA